MTPTLSLVTGTRNRPAELNRLFNSIVANTSVNWELIIADASDYQVFDNYVLNPRGQVKTIRENPPLGYVKGYNRAFAEASGKWVLWLNDDAEVLPNYDVTAINFMESHPEVGLGCLAFRDRCWQEFRVCTFWGMPYANFGIMRREFGNQIGWFWDGLQMYGSDNSITFEVLLAGKGVAAIKGPLIHHHRTDDALRKQNELRRKDDSVKLTARYRQKLPQLLAAYHKQLA